jgi:Mn2+/Fe2+ NRAMP family transporter
MFGAMLSPYLFFWQASQEVEEKKAVGRRLPVAREGASKRQLMNRKVDVGFGTFFSILVIYFIILTTALTLHAHNVTDLQTSQQVAEALQPMAGPFAATLYTIGLVGTGLLAIPVLAGSSAYAFAETFVWKEGLDRPVASAPYFYGLIGTATLLGIALVFFGINPIKALFWASTINGILAPFLLLGILLVSCDRKLMHGKPSSWPARIALGLTAALMLLAAVAMFAR